MIIQPIINIAEICALHGIEQAVICPGSRSAPLTLAFARHPKIKTFVIPDERSAGFIGLGLAQSRQKAVAIICTSGTAVANLYPSIIEAYYQRVPILILTADRPAEWIDQQDGQTIRQKNIFQNHVVGSFQFPVSFDHEDAVWHAEKMISQAIIQTSGKIQGPVHVNVPIREPFYPSPEEEFHYSTELKIIKSSNFKTEVKETLARDLVKEITNHEKVMVLVGQSQISEKLKTILGNIQKKLKWIVVGDITANIDGLNHPITKHDIILKDHVDIEHYKPDLLITFGQSVLSKTLKNYLRGEHIAEHWSIGIENDSTDSFKSLTRKINLDAEVFFQIVEEYGSVSNNKQIAFFNHWTKKELQANAFIEEFFKIENHSELHAVYKLMQQLPHNCHLHLANSMPVRYANLLGISNKVKVAVWSNRGTSGIDGCLSTCVGHTINSTSLNILLTGDMAFFYDRNGLWHNYIPKNLRIVLLNNHGGGIFRLINGPKQLEELEEYFETKQHLNAANTARDFGMKYFSLKNIEFLPELLNQFFKVEAGPSILEIETDPSINQKVFEEFNHKTAQLWN